MLACTRALAIALILSATPLHAQPASVSVEAVTLSTGGLAEVTAQMDTASDTAALSVLRPQVPDVLKTLVVRGNAPVAGIDLRAARPTGAQSPVTALLGQDLATPGTLLSVLVGDVVTVRGGTREVTGTLLAYGAVSVPGPEPDTDQAALRVAVAAEDGSVTFATFVEADGIAVSGTAADAALAELTPALRDSVDEGRRIITLRLGAEDRAQLSFVVPTSVWRPSYRALIAADGTASLQGFATFENTTGLDWDAVSLTLSVGTPVAYAQDIYSPLETERPDAPFAVGETAQTDLVAPAPRSTVALGQFRGRRATGAGRAGQLAFAAPAAEVADAAPLVTGEPPVSGSAATLFDVADPVDLGTGRALTVPFLSAEREVERVATLSLDRRPLQPMDALRIAFDETATVPGGLVAVYDAGAYVGDARFGGTDGGEDALLPFAVSAELDVSLTDETDTALTAARIADGTLTLTRRRERRRTLEASARDAVALIADGATEGSRFAVESGEAVDASVRRLSSNSLRLTASLPEGDSALTIVETRLLSESVAVTNLTTSFITGVLATGGAIDAETRAALERARTLAGQIARIERRVETIERTVDDLREAVALDRENLEAIDVTTPDGARVRQRIVARTDEIAALLDEARALAAERLEAEAALGAL